MRIAVWTGGVLPLVLILALGGCGGDSSTSGTSSTASVTSSTTGGSPAAITGGAGAQSPSKTGSVSAGAVASVEATPVTQATFAHWLAVTAALSGASGHAASASDTALKDKVMGFLLTSEWVLGEAAALGVDVSEAEIHKRLEEVQKKQFKKPAELQEYLTKNHETMADLLLRVKLELLESAISRKVTATKHTAAEKKAALASFQAQFQSKWKAKTSCAAGYVTEDCKQ
jgi:SurA N-terminal domain